MKKLLLFFGSFLLLQARTLSPIPLPQTYFIDLDTYRCDTLCLQEHLQRGEIFSFLAKVHPTNPQFQQEYKKYATLFHLPLDIKKEYRIALLGSKEFKAILQKSIKSLSLKLLQENIPFHITISFIQNSLQESIDKFQDSDLIILYLPYEGSLDLENLHSKTPIYIPTLNKRITQNEDPFYYGGIDYYSQIQQLLRYSFNHLAIFYLPKNALSRDIANFTKEQKEASLIPLKNRGTRLKYLLNKDLNNSDIFLDTPPVVSALVLSQLTLYSYAPPLKLSTQFNYTPKIINLTQERDREHLLLANSITAPSKQDEALTQILDMNLRYDWLLYANFLGIENLLLHQQTKERFIDKQLHYDTQIMEVRGNAFVEVSPQNREGSSLDDRF